MIETYYFISDVKVSRLIYL